MVCLSALDTLKRLPMFSSTSADGLETVSFELISPSSTLNNSFLMLPNRDTLVPIRIKVSFRTTNGILFGQNDNFSFVFNCTCTVFNLLYKFAISLYFSLHSSFLLQTSHLIHVFPLSSFFLSKIKTYLGHW